MLYLLALLFPPMAILACGKPFQALFNFLIWCVTLFSVVGLLIPILHGLLVVLSYEADRRQVRLVRDVAAIQALVLAGATDADPSRIRSLIPPDEERPGPRCRACGWQHTRARRWCKRCKQSLED